LWRGKLQQCLETALFLPDEETIFLSLRGHTEEQAYVRFIRERCELSREHKTDTMSRVSRARNLAGPREVDETARTSR
jgi:hypothetical protein